MITKDSVIEAYMINDKRVIAEMLYDTITVYEERTCESCRYAIKRGFMDKICDNESGIAYDVVVKTTDGCNKWATK
jgi:hypothetical protein